MVIRTVFVYVFIQCNFGEIGAKLWKVSRIKEHTEAGSSDRRNEEQVHTAEWEVQQWKQRQGREQERRHKELPGDLFCVCPQTRLVAITAPQEHKGLISDGCE